jgi:hypothetical protein
MAPAMRIARFLYTMRIARFLYTMRIARLLYTIRIACLIQTRVELLVDENCSFFQPINVNPKDINLAPANMVREL